MTHDNWLFDNLPLIIDIVSVVLTLGGISLVVYVVHVKITDIHQCFTTYFQTITQELEVINNITIEQRDEVEAKLDGISESIENAMGHIKGTQDQIESNNNRLNNFYEGLADVLRKDAEIKDTHQNSQTDDTKE